jgi:Transmembrane amino acid transporter protein
MHCGRLVHRRLTWTLHPLLLSQHVVHPTILRFACPHHAPNPACFCTLRSMRHTPRNQTPRSRRCRHAADVEAPLLAGTSNTPPDTGAPPEQDPAHYLPDGASLLQTVMSILNIVMGIGILSMPYAMAQSGLIGIASVALCCLLFCTSGKCIAWSMELLPAGAPHSYPQLGHEAMGEVGRRLVSAFAVLDLLGGSCIMLIVLWSSVSVRDHLFPRLAHACCVRGPGACSTDVGARVWNACTAVLARARSCFAHEDGWRSRHHE